MPPSCHPFSQGFSLDYQNKPRQTVRNMSTTTKQSSTLLALMLLACSACMAISPSQTPSKKPDIVFIIVDDLNDWIGVSRGHPQSLTPNMDALAAKGVLFSNAHCNAPQCKPSRRSLLDGLYPKSTGSYFNVPKKTRYFGNQPLSGRTTKKTHETVRLHQHFLNNDYRVVSGGKVDHYKKPNPVLDSYLPLQKTKNANGASDKKNLWGDVGAQELEDKQTGDYKVAQWGITEWNIKTDQPLFMTIGFYRPHRPLNAPKKYFDKFPVETTELPLVKTDDWNDLSPYAIGMARAHAHKPFFEGGLSDHDKILEMGGVKEWAYMVSSYLACVNYVDTQIGLFLDALETNPRGRDTIIVLTTDHGWNLGEKKHWTKAALWNNTTRIPFIVVAPGIAKANTRNAQPISLVDVYPTLSDFAGLEPPKHLEGRSILPLLKSKTEKRRYAFLSYGPENTVVQSETMRYIRYEEGSEELYDHAKDPHEWVNLAEAKDYQSIKRELAAQALSFQSN